jgi:hypothetical protein
MEFICSSKNTICVLFRIKLVLFDKGSEQAKHRGMNRNFINVLTDVT